MGRRRAICSGLHALANRRYRPLSMPTALPLGEGAGNEGAARGRDDASQPVLDIGAQSRIERKLGCFRSPV